jgi:hypothetical protein
MVVLGVRNTTREFARPAGESAGLRNDVILKRNDAVQKEKKNVAF